jgi:hypothetical protein
VPEVSFLFFVLFCALLLTTGKCHNNKIACIWGSIHGKACVACMKAKQRCRVFGGEEKQPAAESMVLGEVMTILRELVEVLRGIHVGMRGLEEAFDGHWVPVGNEEEESNKEEGGESELDEELVGLSEEATDYRAFWWAKYGGEYQALVAGEDGRNVLKELEKEKEKEQERGKEKEKEKKGDEGDKMEVDGMVVGLSESMDYCKNYSTYYFSFFCFVCVFILL